MTYGTISATRLKVMFWNCRGYPGLNDLTQGMNIIFLPKIWEHEAKLSPDLDHKPLYLDLAIPHSTRCRGVKDEKRCIIRPCYEKAKMYAKEVENHLLNFSLSNNVKENWQHLKDIILKVAYQYF